jgi:hypothetical protein
MSNFVMGLLVAQLLGGVYLTSFLWGAGQRYSNARATRIPDYLVVLHPMLAAVATGLWLIWMFDDSRGWAWATFATLLLTAAGGTVMFLITRSGGKTLDRPAADPADVRVAEKQIPPIADHLHGLMGTALIVCTLLVALDVLA